MLGSIQSSQYSGGSSATSNVSGSDFSRSVSCCSTKPSSNDISTILGEIRSELKNIDKLLQQLVSQLGGQQGVQGGSCASTGQTGGAASGAGAAQSSAASTGTIIKSLQDELGSIQNTLTQISAQQGGAGIAPGEPYPAPAPNDFPHPTPIPVDCKPAPAPTPPPIDCQPPKTPVPTPPPIDCQPPKAPATKPPVIDCQPPKAPAPKPPVIDCKPPAPKPDCKDDSWSVGEVKNGKGEIKLGKDYTLTFDESKEEFLVKNNCTGDVTRVWGDPHVDVGNDGKGDWNFKKDSTFQLADGTKITVGTVDADGRKADLKDHVSFSSKLTITKGDKAIQLTGLAGNHDGKNNVKVTSSGDGKRIDAATPDGVTVKEKKGGWELNGKTVNQGDYNKAEKGATTH